MTNTYRYLPDTEQDKKEMLDFLGLSSIDQLFEDIPANLRLKGELDLPDADPEPVLLKKMHKLAGEKQKCRSVSNVFRCWYIRSLYSKRCGSYDLSL